MKLSATLLVVRDMQASREYYQRLFDQEVVLDFGENITFSDGFSLQTLESWSKFIDIPEDRILPGKPDFELYFDTCDFDGFLQRLTPTDKLLHGEKRYPWGQRVIRLLDPDGHVIEVGEDMRSVIRRMLLGGKSVEETALITQHPIEMVKEVQIQIEG